MAETILHTLGLCGDYHPTLISLLLEVPQIDLIFTFLKHKQK